MLLPGSRLAGPALSWALSPRNAAVHGNGRAPVPSPGAGQARMLWERWGKNNLMS